MRQDWLKLRRPLLVWAGAAVVLVLAVLALNYQSAARARYLPWEQDVRRLEQACERDADAPACTAGGELTSARQQRAYVIAEFPRAAAMQDPISIGGVVGGHFASLLGLVVIGAIAAAHVAGEWALGTIRPLLARDPRRLRLLLIKFFTTWLAGVLMLMVAWAAAAALAIVFRAGYDGIPPVPQDFDGHGWAVASVWRAVVVLGFFAALCTLVATLTRSPLATMATVLLLAFVFQVASAWSSTFQATPGYWVSAWMGFEPSGLWGDHLWSDQFPLLNPEPGFRPDPRAGLTGIVLGIAAALTLAAVRLRRSGAIG
jgi:ABC-2 family transporter protein